MPDQVAHGVMCTGTWLCMTAVLLVYQALHFSFLSLFAICKAAGVAASPSCTPHYIN